MPVAASTPVLTYVGNGATTSFAISFPFIDNTHLVIQLLDAEDDAVLATWSSGVDFNFVGGNPATSITAVVAPAATEKVRIRRVTPRTQTSDYDVNDTYITESLEDGLDKLTLIVQEAIQANVETQAEVDDLLTDILAAQAAAEAAQAAAETAETNAELAETNAETAEANAETAETNAELAETNAEAAQAAAEAAQAAAEAAQAAAEAALSDLELEVQNLTPFMSGSYASPEAISAGTGINFDSESYTSIWFVIGAAGADVTVTANPQITDGVNIGQILHIVGCASSPNGKVVLSNGNNLKLNGAAHLEDGSSLTLVWIGADWLELARNGM